MANYQGGAGGDTYQGGADNDDITGYAGNDTLGGGDGSDIIYGDDYSTSTPDGDDKLFGGNGADLLVGGLGNDSLSGGDGDDVLATGMAQGERFSGGVRLSSWFGSDGGNDVLDGGAGVDHGYLFYFGRTQGITLSIADPTVTSTILSGGVAVGSITGVERIYFGGGAGADDITGGALNDSLLGELGNDSLRGGAGDDFLTGGQGDDLLDGGTGLDQASYSAASTGVTVDLRLTTAQNTGGGGIDTLRGVENVTGTSSTDRLTGDDNANNLDGLGGGDDVLIGLGGNDFLSVYRSSGAAAGMVTLDGGAGNDNLYFSSYSSTAYIDTASLSGGEGSDYIASFGLGVGVIDAGAGADTVRYDTLGGRYTITLGEGADVLELAGTAGAFRASADNVITDFQTGAGGDRLELTGYLSSALTGTVGSDPRASGHMRLVQSGADTLLQIDRDGGGDAFSTVLTFQNTTATAFTEYNLDLPPAPPPPPQTRDGTSGSDTIQGGGGQDLIRGFAGADVLRGGGGPFTFAGDGLDGGEGDDQLFGEDGDDLLIGGLGADTMEGGEGGDQINHNGGTITGSFESFRFVPELGHSVPFLFYNTNQDRSDDGAADKISGGEGNDSVSVGLNDTADGGNGTDFLGVNLSALTSGVDLDLSTDTQARLAAAAGGSFSNFENFSVRGTTFADRFVAQSTGGSFDGDAGNDVLQGGDGADGLTGGSGADTVRGGLGNDSLTADQYSFFSLIGPDRTPAWRFDDGARDELSGGEGNDNISIGLNDVADGGAGNDALSISLAGRTSGVSLDLRTDPYGVLSAATGSTLANFEIVSGVAGTAFNDVIIWGGAANTLTTGGTNLYGGDGNDRIVGDDRAQFAGGESGNDTLDAAGGNDRLWGGDGDDSLLGGDGADVIDADLDNTRPTVFAGADIADGGNGNDAISGGGGMDTLIGGAGADTVSAGDGNDVLFHSITDNPSGNGFNHQLRVTPDDNSVDVLNGENGNDEITIGQFDVANGGDGVDTVNFSFQGRSSGLNLVFAGDGLTTMASALGATISNFESSRLIGSNFADTVAGADANDRLYGVDGNDVLTGNNGHDILVGGRGGDNLSGGDGDDIVTHGDNVRANGIHYEGWEDSTRDTLDGGGGDDLVRSGRGDIARGGEGEDFLYINYTWGMTSGAVLDLSVNPEAAIAASLGMEISGFELYGVVASGFGDRITMTAGDDIVLALAGNDTVNGGAGVDILSGMEGDDQLNGGQGNDFLFGHLGNDAISGGEGDDVISDEGYIFAFLPEGQPGGDDSFFGDAGNDTLTGLGGNDFLDGGADHDILDGGAGDDLLRGGRGVDTISGGAGRDRVSFFDLAATQAVVVDLRTQTISNDGFGNAETMSSIESLGAGTAFADTFHGDDGDNDLLPGLGDFVYGHGGNDSIVIGGAPSIVDGGAGSDTLGFTQSRTVQDTDNDGRAEVQTTTAGVSVNLAAGRILSDGFGGSGDVVGIENLSGSAGSDTLIGNDQANVIMGSFGADTINAAGGADTVQVSGPVEADRITLGAGSDVLEFLAGAGRVTAAAAGQAVVTDFQAGAGGDRLELSGYLSTSLTGLGAGQNPFETGHLRLVQSGADTLLQIDYDGLSGLNSEFVTLLTLSNVSRANLRAENLDGFDPGQFQSGGAGGDTLAGGAGSDAIDGGEGGDQLDGGAGSDALDGGTGNDSLSGGEGSDLLLGGDGDDTVEGGNGDDLIIGGSGQGNDSYSGGDGVDAVRYTSTSLGVWVDLAAGQAAGAQIGSDTLSGIENATGGSGSDALNGSAGANILLGGAGSDILNGRGGSDVLDGGAGVDEALYSGASRQYSRSFNAGAGTVGGGREGGTDTLSGVEVLNFTDGKLVSDSTDSTAQVWRLYQTFFARDADYSGHQHWVNQMESGGTSLQGIADLFTQSAEFAIVNGALSNRSYVEALYQRALGRAADDGGATHWTSQLDSGALSRAQVAVMFSESQEQINRSQARVDQGFWVEDGLASSVARIYYTAFGRAPDGDGLSNWRDAIDAGADLNAVARGFMNSQEFFNLYGNLNNAQYVDKLYQVALGRTPDAEGRQNWINALDSGAATRADMVLNFSESQEMRNKTASLVQDGIRLLGQGAPGAGAEAAPVGDPEAAGVFLEPEGSEAAPAEAGPSEDGEPALKAPETADLPGTRPDGGELMLTYPAAGEEGLPTAALKAPAAEPEPAAAAAEKAAQEDDRASAEQAIRRFLNGERADRAEAEDAFSFDGVTGDQSLDDEDLLAQLDDLLTARTLSGGETGSALHFPSASEDAPDEPVFPPVPEPGAPAEPGWVL